MKLLDFKMTSHATNIKRFRQAWPVANGISLVCLFVCLSVRALQPTIFFAISLYFFYVIPLTNRPGDSILEAEGQRTRSGKILENSKMAYL